MSFQVVATRNRALARVSARRSIFYGTAHDLQVRNGRSDRESINIAALPSSKPQSRHDLTRPRSVSFQCVMLAFGATGTYMASVDKPQFKKAFSIFFAN